MNGKFLDEIIFVTVLIKCLLGAYKVILGKCMIGKIINCSC